MKLIIFHLTLGSLMLSCSGRSRGPSAVIDPAYVIPSENTEQSPAGTPVSRNGALSIARGALVGAGGAVVQLRGVSTAALGTNTKLYNKDSLRWLRDDWHLSVIRTAMSDIDQASDLIEFQDKVKDLIAIAIDLGIYIIIEWRVARDGDPFTSVEQAAFFFDPFLEKYGAQPNIIYDISFEAAQTPGAWDAAIKPYVQEIIPLIRQKAPKNIVIIEGAALSTLLEELERSPIANDDNVMIGLRLDPESLDDEHIEIIKTAKSGGSSLFVEQISASVSDETLSTDKLNQWLDDLAESHISWTASALTSDEQPDALLTATASRKGGWEIDDLTPTGNFMRAKIRGDAPGTDMKKIEESSDDSVIPIAKAPPGGGGMKDTSPGDLPEIVMPDSTL